MTAPARILVVDDERGMREGCKRILASEGYEVETAEDGVAGLDLFLRRGPFDAALVDLKMPRMSGIELVEQIRLKDPDVVLLIITAYATIETAVEATKRGAYGYIPKPFTPEELLLPVRNGLEHRALALETRRLRAEAEHERMKLVTAKSTFISMVAHEIKNPLAAVEGYLEAALQELPADQRAVPMLRRALTRAQGLDAMIADLLSLTTIETGNFTPHRTPQDLRPILRKVVNAQTENARKANITLQLELGEMPVVVPADHDAVFSIFNNLVDNAIKYTPEGGRVRLSLRREGAFHVIEVADNGMGIAPEDQERIFEEFFRIRNERVAKVPGTGLGLSLVKKLVGLHEGHVQLFSEPGKGSRFLVSLPATDG